MSITRAFDDPVHVSGVTWTLNVVIDVTWAPNASVTDGTRAPDAQWLMLPEHLLPWWLTIPEHLTISFNLALDVSVNGVTWTPDA